MAIKRRHVKAVIQLRRATEREWIELNPILRVGEPALSTDVYKLKIGDGTRHWKQIPYLTNSGGGGGTEYIAGNGIVIEGDEIRLDELILDCGTSTTNTQESGTSSTVNTRIQHKRDTTANWNKARGFIPLDGELIIYTDYSTITKEINGKMTQVYVAGVKIGDGKAYVQDLPFVDEELRSRIMAHINNPTIHVSTQEKTFWNNKLNVDDDMELVDGALVLNRN